MQQQTDHIDGSGIFCNIYIYLDQTKFHTVLLRQCIIKCVNKQTIKWKTTVKKHKIVTIKQKVWPNIDQTKLQSMNK